MNLDIILYLYGAVVFVEILRSVDDNPYTAFAEAAMWPIKFICKLVNAVLEATVGKLQ